MPVLETNDGRRWRQRTRAESLFVWFGWFVAAVVAVICFRFVSDQTIWAFVWDAPTQVNDLASRMVPPEWSYANRLWRPLWDTINIATFGTLIAVVLCLPVAFAAARNTTPHPIFRQVSLLIIVFSRSVNSLIWALLLVSILGPGVLAGIIAIALRSVGFLSKLLYEAIEEIDPRPIEALRATGAKPQQVIGYGVAPQIMPAFVGTSVYRWDINLRESTVVGLVGAGGIGLQLNSAIGALAWSQATVIFLMILGLVLVSEWVSARARQAIT